MEVKVTVEPEAWEPEVPWKKLLGIVLTALNAWMTNTVSRTAGYNKIQKRRVSVKRQTEEPILPFCNLRL